MASSIQHRFEKFHEQHPEIYAGFKRLALQIYQQGRKHYGAKAIFEYMRLHQVLASRDEMEPFKINNNYISRYVRLLIAEQPQLARFFELRQLRSEIGGEKSNDEPVTKL